MNTYTGGLSVEFYTDGQYTTQDIDIITVAEKELNQVLLNLDFAKSENTGNTNDWN